MSGCRDKEVMGMGRDRGVNTFGQPIKGHDTVIEEMYAAYMRTLYEIRDYLVAKGLPKQASDWEGKRFGFIYMKPYCKETYDKLMPAEFAVVVFSFKEGIEEILTAFIDPGKIPLAQRGDMWQACEINGYPYPQRDFPLGSPLKYKEEDGGTDMIVTAAMFVRSLTNLANKYGLFNGKEFFLFTPKSDIPVISSCLHWVKSKLGYREEKTPYRLLPFEILAMEMSRLVKNHETTQGVMRTQGGAGGVMYHTRFDFTKSIGCKWHTMGDAQDKIDRCSKHIACCRVYNVLFHLRYLFKKEVVRGKHEPF